MLIPFLLCAALSGGRAQQPAAAPDFSDGFKQLAALGMPPLDAQAKWSVIPEAANSSYELRDMVKAIKGNAWLLPSADGKLRALALGGVEVIECEPAKKPPAEPDLTKDVAAVTAALKKLAAKINAEDRDPFGSGLRSGGSMFGTFLLFGTQLHQSGHPALANQLALAVFEVLPSREAAVDAAIDLLADHFYQQATRAFFSSGDWAAYHQALGALAKRFPRGWSSHDAVGLFLPQLAKQAGGAIAPAPALPDTPIDPRATAIIRELTEKPPAAPNKPNTKDKPARALSPAMRYRMRYSDDSDGGQFSPSPLWLIGDSADSAEAADSASNQASPLARLVALKMAAIPALAALAADPFLTHLPNAHSYSGYSGYFSSNESSDERTLRYYATLNRPATRGEIAIQLLAATLPETENEPNQADPEVVRDLALAFWKAHKDATREDLAAVFLREGSNSQASQAASILAASSDPKAHKAFEAHVLAADPAIACFQDVRTYLRARKAAARPFFDAYAKLVRSQIQDAGGDSERSNRYEYAIKEAGGPEKILKQLEALIGGQSPRALAVQIAKGPPADAEAAIKSLSSLLADATPTKHLHALLEGANAATDPGVRARFLTATLSIRWNDAEADSDPEADQKPDSPPADRKVSEPEAVVWRKLIADTTKLPNIGARFLADDNTTVGGLAALAYEFSISPDNYSDARQAATILGKTFFAILIERGTARIAGMPVTPFPDASRVAKDRLAAIVAEAGKKSTAEIHPYLATLTPDERAAWLEWIDEPGELAVPDSVQALHSLIVSRSITQRSGSQDVKGAANIEVGFNVTPAGITQHIEALAPQIDKHSRADVSIHPADFGPGLQVFARVFPLPEPKTKPAPDQSESDDDESFDSYPQRAFALAIRLLKDHDTAAAIAIATLQGEDSYPQEAVWLIANGKATLYQPDPQDSDDERATFAATLTKMLDPKAPARFSIRLQFLSRADAKRFTPPSEDEEALPDLPE